MPQVILSCSPFTSPHLQLQHIYLYHALCHPEVQPYYLFNPTAPPYYFNLHLMSHCVTCKFIHPTPHFTIPHPFSSHLPLWLCTTSPPHSCITPYPATQSIMTCSIYISLYPPYPHSSDLCHYPLSPIYIIYFLSIIYTIYSIYSIPPSYLSFSSTFPYPDAPQHSLFHPICYSIYSFSA